jgi:hypothetical protein
MHKKWIKIMNDDDENEVGSEEEFPVYIVDDATQELLETALNCMITLSDAQIDPAAGDALAAIADSLAERFAINRFEVEETVHTHEDGEEEVIYKPKGGIMPDNDEE